MLNTQDSYRLFVNENRFKNEAELGLKITKNYFVDLIANLDWSSGMPLSLSGADSYGFPHFYLIGLYDSPPTNPGN